MLDFSDGAALDLVPLHRHDIPGYGRSPKADAVWPWLFNRFMIEFLAKHDLFPGKVQERTRALA